MQWNVPTSLIKFCMYELRKKNAYITCHLSTFQSFKEGKWLKIHFNYRIILIQ